MLCGCSISPFDRTTERIVAKPRIERLRNIALSWPEPPRVDALVGARLIEDGRPGMGPALALAHVILRTNERIEPAAALMLADATVRAAERNGLPPEFLGATLLQESAFDPHAVSPAGAIGIAQFMMSTALDHHVDPFDPYAAIEGAARLLASYVRAYRPVYPDPYSTALAAYNAGPGAVERYGGIPPYPETLQYVQYIDERWGNIAAFEVHGTPLSKSGPRGGGR